MAQLIFDITCCCCSFFPSIRRKEHRVALVLSFCKDLVLCLRQLVRDCRTGIELE